MAIVRTQCESFPEDTSAVYHEIYAPITTPLISCELQDFNFLWGRNFVADGELVSVAAGLYGQIRPTEAEVDAFENNVIPAALFSLGIIELAPSEKIVVRAEVDVQFLVFMLLPILLGIIVYLIAYKKRGTLLPVPMTPWQLMVAGKEQADIQKKVEGRNLGTQNRLTDGRMRRKMIASGRLSAFLSGMENGTFFFRYLW